MRILGITIPNEKRVDIGLTVLFGIGRPMSVKILNDAKVDVSKKVSELSDKEENDIRKIVEAMNIEGNLKREISANIKRLKDIKAYRGVRHLRKMPVRGQRTKTNSRTVRGNVQKTKKRRKRKTEKT